MREIKHKMCFLRDVTSLSKNDREKYLTMCSEKNIHLICESLHNILTGVCTKKKIKKDKFFNQLKKLSSPKLEVNKKRKILTSQYGHGIFSLIATTALPFLIDLLKKYK